MLVSGLQSLPFPCSSTRRLLCKLLILMPISPMQVEHDSQCYPYCCRYICTAFAVACIFYDSMQVSKLHDL